LIISDLPRENSATKATMTLSERTCVPNRRNRSSIAESSNSLSFIHSAQQFQPQSELTPPCAELVKLFVK